MEEERKGCVSFVLDTFAQKNVLQKDACITLEDKNIKRQQLQTDHGESFNPGRKKGCRASACSKYKVKGVIYIALAISLQKSVASRTWVLNLNLSSTVFYLTNPVQRV